MNNLKLFTGQIVATSKLTKESKLQLLNFIQREATEPQIKAFLMDGKITKLNKEAENIVNERFEVHETKQLINEIEQVRMGVGLGASGLLFYGLVLTASIWAAYRVIKSVASKKARQCGTLSIGMKRKVCLAKLKLEEATKMKDLIIKNMKGCDKQKNPQKCIAKHKKVIQKMIDKEKKYSEKLKKYNIKNPEKTVKGLERAKKPMK